MKKLFTLFAGLLLMGSLQAEAADFETAKEAVKNMGVGWNLGNTLDANDATKSWNSTAEHETCWGQPVTKPELIKMMKEAGFGAIRVPVTWYQEIDADGKINEAWMNRVKEVVDYVIREGLYCIINVHHDTGADGSTFKSWIKADEANYTQNRAKFENIWKQIAQTFKDYDQHLLFEGYNEMLDANNCWCYPTFYEDQKNYDANYAKKSLETINNYAKSFVNAVRYTGGNNMKRNLIVNTYAASPGGNWGHANEVVDQFKLPTGESDHIIVEVHSYPNISSGFSFAQSNIDWIFSNINTKIIKKFDVPVIIGEWGSSNVDKGAGMTDYDVRKDEFFKFADYWVKKAKALNIATFYWMGLSDGMYRSTPAFNQPDLAETIAKAYHGADFNGVYPTMQQSESVVVFEGELPLEWGTAVNFPPALFSDFDNSTFVEVTYEQKHVEGYGMLQFWYSDWSVKIDFMVDGKNYSADFTPSDHYGTPDGTVHTTAFSFDANTFSNIKKKGVLFQGHGIVVKKAILTKTPTSISTVVETSPGNDLFYNLNGQRIEKPQKGLYIQNGKKYIVR